jgi:hypothetical protein
LTERFHILQKPVQSKERLTRPGFGPWGTLLLPNLRCDRAAGCGLGSEILTLGVLCQGEAPKAARLKVVTGYALIASLIQPKKSPELQREIPASLVLGGKRRSTLIGNSGAMDG